MPCSGFNGGSIEFDTAESDFCAGAGDWAFPSSIICSPAAAASRHAAGDVDADDRRPLSSSSSSDAGNNTTAAAVGDASLAASTCVPHPQSVLMCLPHLDGAGSFTSTIPEMRDSSDSKFSKYRVDMTTSSKMEVEDESPPQPQQPGQGESGQAEGGRKSNRKDGGGGGGESKRVNGAGEEEEEDEEVVEEEEEEGDELFFQPPRRISMLWNSKLRWREERKKVLKISIAKLRRIEDPELSLCRAILINNTVKRLHREIREEKTSRYPDVIRPVPMVTAYHLASSIPEAFPRKRSSSTHTSPPPAPTHSSPHSYDYALDSHNAYCNNDKENRNCSDSVVIDYMNIDSVSTALPTESVTTPSPAKRARLTNSKSDVVSNVCYSTSSSETSMVDVNDYRSNDLRTAVTTNNNNNGTSPLTCHQQQYQTSSTPFQTFSCTQSAVNGTSQLLELNSETVTKSAKSDANSSSTQRTHLISLDCCTKDELSNFTRFTNLTSSSSTTTTTTSSVTTSTTNNNLPSPKDKRDLMASEYEKQYSQYSCGQFSIFGELQSVVFHSLITSLES